MLPGLEPRLSGRQCPHSTGVALPELAHGGHAARVIEQHDVHAPDSQEAEVAFDGRQSPGSQEAAREAGPAIRVSYPTNTDVVIWTPAGSGATVLPSGHFRQNQGAPRLCAVRPGVGRVELGMVIEARLWAAGQDVADRFLRDAATDITVVRPGTGRTERPV